MNGRTVLAAATAPVLVALLFAAPRSPARQAGGTPGSRAGSPGGTPESAAPAPAASPIASPPAASETGIFGFLRGSLPRQGEIEALLLSLPDAARSRSTRASSPRNRTSPARPRTPGWSATSPTASGRRASKSR